MKKNKTLSGKNGRRGDQHKELKQHFCLRVGFVQGGLLSVLQAQSETLQNFRDSAQYKTKRTLPAQQHFVRSDEVKQATNKKRP